MLFGNQAMAISHSLISKLKKINNIQAMTTPRLTLLYVLLFVTLCDSCTQPNCLTCPNDICQQCQDTYYLTSINTCSSCLDSHCRVCNTTACIACQTGYFLSYLQQTCEPCSAINCNVCEHNGNCLKCQDGYYPIQNSGGMDICYRCPEKCDNCNEDGECLVCQDGYFRVQTGDGSFCQSCATNLCETCDQDGNCLTCTSGTYLYTSDNTTRCYPCGSPNCLICQTSTQLCTSCRTGYYLDLTDNITDQCVSCKQYGCAACSGPNNCSDCLDGYRYENGSCVHCQVEGCKNCDFGHCTLCLSGYFLKPIQGGMSCVPCADIGCETCASSSYCTNCTVGHYLSNNRCLPCSDQKCLNCNSTTCLQCAPQYIVRKGELVCTKCPLNQCLQCDELGQCLQCTAGKFIIDGKCVKCAVSNCEQCVEGQVSACQQCAEGYFLNASLCQQCPIKNCYQCDTIDQCQSCVSGYYLTETKQCEQCTLSNCYQCRLQAPNPNLNQESGTLVMACQECESGFVHDQSTGYCKIYEEDRSQPWWFWVFISLALLVLIMGVIFYGYRWFLRWRMERGARLTAEQGEGDRRYQQFRQIGQGSS